MTPEDGGIVEGVAHDGPPDAAGAREDALAAVKVEILGQPFTLRADSDRRYVLEVAKYVDGKMREITRKLPVASMAKVAVLASLNIADELLKERQARARDAQHARLRAQQLGAQLDRALDGDPK